MIKKQKRPLSRLGSGILSTVLIFSVCVSVHAEPTSEALKQKSSDLRIEIHDLDDELISLSDELDEASSQIEKLAAEAEKGKLDLAAAKLNESAQYASMKERIKFMYEEGNISLLNTLFASKSMADFLNKAEYVSTISEYDRQMLNKLRSVRSDVEKKQDELEKKQKKLTSLAEKLKEKKEALTRSMASASGELDDYEVQLKRAKAAEKAMKNAQDDDVASPLKKDSSNQSRHEKETAEAVSADTSDVALLAAILQCEAGTSYDGMLAVGTVIMNRVISPNFPNSISGVIYQSGQFSPVGNGSLNTVLANGPSTAAYSAAQAVIGGARHSSVSNCYFFYADWYAKQQGVSGINVGGNVFFNLE